MWKQWIRSVNREPLRRSMRYDCSLFEGQVNKVLEPTMLLYRNVTKFDQIV